MNLKQLFGYGVVLYILYAFFGNPVTLNIGWGQPLEGPGLVGGQAEEEGIEGEVLICRSKGAEAFHARRCWGLDNCRRAVIRVEAMQADDMGYRPCKICYGRY